MMRESKRARRLTAAFFFVSLLLFAETSAFGFIGLDDAGYTFRNPFVATGLTIGNIAESFFNFRHGGIWMPLTYSSYMLDIELSRWSGISLSAWMHFVNNLFHALNAVLLILFASRLSSAVRGRVPLFPLFIAAAFWTFHPLRAEPVAWIACRKELLWVFFSLLGLIFWLNLFNRKSSAKTSGINLTLTFVCFVAACLSKPSAMCFPFLAGAVQMLLVVVKRRQGYTAPFTPVIMAAVYGAMLVVAGATASIAAYSQTHVAGQEAMELFVSPLGHRVLHALSALGFYLRAIVCPIGLHIDCRIVEGALPLGGIANIAVLALAVSLLAAAAVRFKVWKFPATCASASFLLVWFIVPLVPTLGIFGSFGIEAHADRFTYLPMMAIVLFAALCPFSKIDVKPLLHRFAKTVALTAVAVYAALLFRQIGFWKDDYVAHLRALSCDPDHPRAMVHVGDALCARFRDFDNGIKLYRRSISLHPREYVRYRLAYALASRGKWEDYQEVKKIGADVARSPSLDRRGMMLDALGTAFMADGNWSKAAEMFKASIAAPGRFWPKASTAEKLEECLERMK